VFTLSVLAITLYLMKYDPKLLEKRLAAGAVAEKQKKQKFIQAIASIAFILVIVFPALDHRLGWSQVPPAVVVLGDALVALGFRRVTLGSQFQDVQYRTRCLLRPARCKKSC
jgi:protein-S-isoprenylcysteine O-methyltransferase Ste14